MKKEKNGFVKNAFDVVSIIGTAVIAIAVVFTFAVRTVSVSGGSMLPTLSNGDKLLLSANLDKAQYGDIVVICQPNLMEKTLIKRVIATENQTVDIDFTTGEVSVDGVVLDEPYIAAKTTEDEGMVFPLVVPEGCVFVLGDNRNASTDSRSPAVGFIDEDYIMGKVLLRIAPWGHTDYLDLKDN